MWPFKKKRISKTVYKVSYVQGAFVDITAGKVIFDLKNLQDKFVEAKDLIDAQMVFAKKTMLAPHVYINRIDKVYTIET